MKNIFYIFLILLFNQACTPQKNHNIVDQDMLSIGPEKGTLLIIGGAAKDPLFLEIFKEYAGGNKANIIVVPKL